MKDIRTVLLHAAHEKGICADGYRQMLESADIDALIDYYVANPDWCMERNFPDLETLREHFADAGEKGVFVDRTFHGELLNDRQVYIFHNCRGKIKINLNVEKSIIPMLYFANGCNMTVDFYQPASVSSVRRLPPVKVPIYSFGKNDVTAESDENVKFKIYKHDLV